MGSWGASKAITKDTWGVVKRNPYMFWFPVVAGVVATVAVLVIAGTGLGVLGITTVTRDVTSAASGGELPTSTLIIGIVILILAAYAGTLITQVCMGGLVHCANEELNGRSSSFGAGIAAAFGRLPALLGWAAIQTAVGWLLSMIQGNGGDNIIITILRAILPSLAAVACSVISFFVLPMIMLRGKGPLSGIKESVKLIRATWGMQIAGGVRIGGMILLIALLPGILALVAGVFLAAGDQLVLGIPLAAIGIVVILAGQVLISALRAVFSVALLHFAEQGQAIGPYNMGELQSAVRVKS